MKFKEIPSEIIINSIIIISLLIFVSYIISKMDHAFQITSIILGLVIFSIPVFFIFINFIGWGMIKQKKRLNHES